jgi:hypothetical protein
MIFGRGPDEWLALHSFFGVISDISLLVAPRSKFTSRVFTFTLFFFALTHLLLFMFLSSNLEEIKTMNDVKQIATSFYREFKSQFFLLEQQISPTTFTFFVKKSGDWMNGFYFIYWKSFNLFLSRYMMNDAYDNGIARAFPIFLVSMSSMIGGNLTALFFYFIVKAIYRIVYGRVKIIEE